MTVSSKMTVVLPRKWRVKAHNQQTILIKGNSERTSHVLMKAFIWALYLPEYPSAKVEVRVGDRYKPDVVAQDDDGNVTFWGESGQVGRDKLYSLLKRYPDTHFAFAKWAKRLKPLGEMVEDAQQTTQRTAPVDLFSFAHDSDERFVSNDLQTVQLTFDDVEWIRYEQRN